MQNHRPHAHREPRSLGAVPSESNLLGDTLFVVQVIGALGVIVPMMVRNWTNIEGLSVSYFVVILAFLCLQTTLAVPAHRAMPTRKTRQILFMCALWLVLTAALLAEIWYRGMYVWDTNDTVTIVLTVFALGLVALAFRLARTPLSDPAARGLMGVMTRAIPQLLQGTKILVHGGGGVAGLSLLFANINTWIRLGHLALTRSEAKEERNRLWMLIPEVVNAFTWLLVSIAWLVWRVGWISP